ncbi:MAG: helix-turn-helix domain-containing protein [Desulfobaccales bacterium]
MAVDIERRRAYHKHYMRLRRAKERELANPPVVKDFLEEWKSLFNVAEAASLLQVCPETVRRWCRRGLLAHVQVGERGRIGIPASALDGCKRGGWRRLLNRLK